MEPSRTIACGQSSHAGRVIEEAEMSGTKRVKIKVAEDVRVQGYGTVEAGEYLVEMPSDYDPALVGAEDIIMDESMRILDEDGSAPDPDDGGMHAETLGYHGDVVGSGHVEDGVWKPGPAK